ncbi:hypothetical protein B0H10DRAFT_1976334 [Mycena sp. CBHHK59/15]|nr:hypothetical protein B0H10DRAFT_1976334 [Mycena sp. CBHHK59/15]
MVNSPRHSHRTLTTSTAAMPSHGQTSRPVPFNAARGDTSPIPGRYNTALAQAGLPTVSHAELDWMLRPYCRTEEELVVEKQRYIASAERSVPTGKIPMLGQKPNDGGEPALKFLPIPGDRLAIRIFPGGFERGRHMFFFYFVDENEQPVNMPPGYSVHQCFAPNNIQLKGLHEVLGFPLDKGDSFAVLEDVWCVLCRPGFVDWQLSTAVQG